MTHKAFQKRIVDFYREHKRDDLPWRRNITPYKILVSEIMLQQTQVDRVIPYFKAWMQAFPSFKKLAEAPQHEVLRRWKGLGYNSRALRLHKLSQIITDEHGGRLPRTRNALESLPGVGPYTAGAVLAFAYNIATPIIETNIRTVYMHHFFSKKKEVSDREVLALVEKHVPLRHSTKLLSMRVETLESVPPPLKGQELSARDWYYALMDYGAYLKKSGIQINSKSKHYTKQSKFAGSDRQLRGKILEILLEHKKIGSPALITALGEPKDRVLRILADLQKEGFIICADEKVQLC